MLRPIRALALLALALSLLGAPAASAQTSVQTAIQDVIARGNAAQTNAIANGDATRVGDTGVGSYAQELIRANQSLLDAGAVAVELVSLEWGDISVSGPSATATTFETWRTSFADGPTEFARDRNVYTLVLGDDGAWKIVGDDHPDGRSRRVAPPPSPSPPSPDVQPGPGTSRNWAGYTARGGTFTSVAASWTVPQVPLDSTFGADAAWVGIGGFRTRDLIQAGTQQTSSGAGSVTYEAWIETLPDVSQPVPLTVLPGDSVTVSVDLADTDTWLITLSNATSGQSLQRTIHYSSSLSSAEWIEEAPLGRRRVLPLSQFGSLQFSSASAVKDGASLTVADLGARPISLVDDAGRALAVPSPLGSDGASFSVSRL